MADSPDTIVVGGLCKHCGMGHLVDEDGLCLDCRWKKNSGPRASSRRRYPGGR